MDIKVRFYEENDFSSVDGILMEAFSCHKNKVEGNMFHEIVGCVDNQVVGYLLLTKVLNPIKNQFYYLVDYVCVSSQFRGMGVADQMLAYAEEIAKDDHAMYLQLTCSRFRIAAHKLYEKYGFNKRDSDIYRKEII